MNTTTKLTQLSDNSLVTNLQRLSSKETEVVAEILLHLIELDERRLYLTKGYSSLFAYCTGCLKYSEPAAARRVKAARCIKNFREVYSLLLEKRVSLTTIFCFADILTEENKDKILRQVSGKSQREVECIVAEYKPEKKIKQYVKPLPSDPKEIRASQTSNCATLTEQSLFSESNTTNHCRSVSKIEQPAPEKTEQKFEFRFSGSSRVMEKYTRVQQLESNKGKDATQLKQLFETLLDEYLKHRDPVARHERREKRVRRSSTKKGISSRKRSRAIPAATRDKIFVRDEMKCCYVSPEGVRCDARRGLQVDHIQPYGKGGSRSEENLRLLCGAHNRLAAERVYGKEFMAQFRGTG